MSHDVKSTPGEFPSLLQQLVYLEMIGTHPGTGKEIMREDGILAGERNGWMWPNEGRKEG